MQRRWREGEEEGRRPDLLFRSHLFFWPLTLFFYYYYNPSRTLQSWIRSRFPSVKRQRFFTAAANSVQVLTLEFCYTQTWITFACSGKLVYFFLLWGFNQTLYRGFIREFRPNMLYMKKKTGLESAHSTSLRTMDKHRKGGVGEKCSYVMSRAAL